MAVNAKALYDKYFGFGQTAFHDIRGKVVGTYGPAYREIDPLVAMEGQAEVKKYLASFGYKRINQPLKQRSDQDCIELDVAMMYGVFDKSDGDEVGLFSRVFNLLYYGALIAKVKTTNGPAVRPWKDTGLPIACAIARGGRFIIQIPRGTGDTFWNWLDGPDKIITRNSRLAATHGLKVIKDYSLHVPLGHGRFHRIEETKSGDRTHYGVNIAMGGKGNYNPVSGNEITSTGEFGHFYCYYLPPTDEDHGGVLMGIEGSAAVDSWDNRKEILDRKRNGEVFDPKNMPRMKSKFEFVKHQGLNELRKGALHSGVDGEHWTPDQYGGFHTLGHGQDFSVTGSKKWEKCSGGLASKYNAMFVDLTGTGIDFVQNLGDFNPNLLGDAGADMPVIILTGTKAIAQKTALTNANLKKLIEYEHGKNKVLSGKSHFVKFKEGEDIKKGKVYGKKSGHFMKIEDFNLTTVDIATNISIDGNTTFGINDWKTLSSIRFGSRNAILEVDNALAKVIEVTNNGISMVKAQPSDVDRAELFSLIRREALIVLFEKLKHYQSVKSDSDRIGAVNGLSTLVKQEITYITKAFQDKNGKVPRLKILSML